MIVIYEIVILMVMVFIMILQYLGLWNDSIEEMDLKFSPPLLSFIIVVCRLMNLTIRLLESRLSMEREWLILLIRGRHFLLLMGVI